MQNAERKVQNEGLTPEEIAESLRVCADPERSCGECHMRSKRGCDKDARIAGAEVIEELAKEVARLQGELILKNAELLKLREANRWIPVEERLPDRELDEIAAVVNTELHYPGFQCLVMIRDAKYPTILNYADIDGDRVWVDDECDWYPVTHWKHMPKGPEEEGQA